MYSMQKLIANQFPFREFKCRSLPSRCDRRALCTRTEYMQHTDQISVHKHGGRGGAHLAGRWNPISATLGHWNRRGLEPRSRSINEVLIRRVLITCDWWGGARSGGGAGGGVLKPTNPLWPCEWNPSADETLRSGCHNCPRRVSNVERDISGGPTVLISVRRHRQQRSGVNHVTASAPHAALVGVLYKTGRTVTESEMRQCFGFAAAGISHESLFLNYVFLELYPSQGISDIFFPSIWIIPLSCN